MSINPNTKHTKVSERGSQASDKNEESVSQNLYLDFLFSRIASFKKDNDMLKNTPVNINNITPIIFVIWLPLIPFLESV